MPQVQPVRVALLALLLARAAAAQEIFPAPAFEAGASPVSLALGDLNGDGRPDAVVASDLTDSVSVLLRTCGGFGPPASVSLGAESHPEVVVLGDLDGDGDSDVFASRSTGRINVLRNDGTGALEVLPDQLAGILPSDAALGDLDADGALDAVIATSEDDVLVVLPGKGDGTFYLPQAFDAAGEQQALALGDMNGDGRLDAVTGNTQKVIVLLSEGAGGLAAPLAYDGGGIQQDVELGDLDGDADLDVVVGHAYGYGAAVVTLENLGDGGLAAPVNQDLGELGTLSLALADFDGNGALDVAAPPFSVATVGILLNSGRSLGAATSFTFGGFRPLRATDLDGDGHADLAAPGSDRLNVLYGDGTGGMIDALTHVADVTVNAFETGDVDGDGLPDLVTMPSVDLQLGLLRGDGFGGFLPHTDIDVPVPVGPVRLGELDGTAGLDLAGVSSISVIQPDVFFALRNDGAGGFYGAVTVALPSDPWDFILADVDGDGLQDGVIGLRSEKKVAVVLSLGGGAFAAPVTQTAGADPRELDAGDFLEDGAVDILVANGTSDPSDGGLPPELRLLLADGLGGLLPSTSLGVASANGNVVADFDNDGHLDIVALEVTLEPVILHGLLLRGDGTGAFAAAEPFGTGSGEVAADVNGDGAMDVVGPWADVRYGDGAGGVAVTVAHSMGTFGHISVADLDADGALDLLAPGDDSVIRVLLQPNPSGSWSDLGDALTGIAGLPRLTGAGLLLPDTPVVVRLQQAAPLAPALLFVSGSDTPVPFKGGVLHALVPLLPLVTSAAGEAELQGSWSPNTPPCSTFVLQAAIADPTAPAGVALSNALEGVSP